MKEMVTWRIFSDESGKGVFNADIKGLYLQLLAWRIDNYKRGIYLWFKINIALGGVMNWIIFYK